VLAHILDELRDNRLPLRAGDGERRQYPDFVLDPLDQVDLSAGILKDPELVDPKIELLDRLTPQARGLSA
jgi:hypothetical protein